MYYNVFIFVLNSLQMGYLIIYNLPELFLGTILETGENRFLDGFILHNSESFVYSFGLCHAFSKCLGILVNILIQCL